MKTDSKIYIAGHNGMVGSAIHRNLVTKGFSNFVFTPFPQFDLTDQKTVADFFAKEKPEYVILAAAKVGGIVANNTYRAQFLYENLMIQNNIIHQSYVNRVKKLLFLGSSCIYPKNCPQPIKEEYLLTGDLEYTNEPYAIAKIAGIKMCESYNIQYGTNFISVMPTNLYGPNDNYNLETSHVLPALIRKMHLGKCLENNDWDALRKDLNKYPIEGVNETSSESDIMNILSKYGIKYTSETEYPESSTEHPAPSIQHPVSITLWGTGSPFREFLYVDDLADACVFLMENVNYADLFDKYPAPSTQHPASSFMSSEPDAPRPKPHADIKNTHINIGTGKDLTIKELAELIRDIVGFNGMIDWDYSKPDGTYRKLLDVGKINLLGWKEKIELEEGIMKVYSKHNL
ncbi:MAG: GDP-L-fucose synthase [Bacteroidales bacterium]|nr:GDP-L-fucose synthase [Bacteroidales bacterium]